MEHPSILHEELYNFLLKYREKDPEFCFTLRRSNRSKKMEDGYWFYGDNFYLAVSFWSGMDWKNKTPNIIFVILVNDRKTYLEISTSDSDEKRDFIERYVVSELRLKPLGLRYRKEYAGSNFMESLEIFLNTDKIAIDKIIQEHADDSFVDLKQGIYFLDKEEFEERKEKVDNYREKRSVLSMIHGAIGDSRPWRIASVKIDNFGPIRGIAIEKIPPSSQWVFLVGENGTGKTSFLRALATALCHRRMSNEEMNQEGSFKISMLLYESDGELLEYVRQDNEDVHKDAFLIIGFAAYGQSRLRTTCLRKEGTSDDAAPDEPYSSLFGDDTYLLDLQQQFDIWKNSKSQAVLYEKRKGFIIEILTDIIPNLYNIDFDDRSGDVHMTSYYEKDKEGGEFKKVTFDMLASGPKSMIAMIGDIMIRLYDQQPLVLDPSEFTGVVLIDEIDIHLHPKLQKQLIEQLTKTFPRVQFFATTHSPIPLLGAPKNSLLYKVERNSTEGVKLIRLDEKLILGDLLPNTILTSPLFGLEDIIPNSHDSKDMVRTEITFRDVDFNDQVSQYINAFITDERENRLIELFKSRRK